MRIATKPDVKHPGQVLSMGFAFVEFRRQRDAMQAIKQLQGTCEKRCRCRSRSASSQAPHWTSINWISSCQPSKAMPPSPPARLVFHNKYYVHACFELNFPQRQLIFAQNACNAQHITPLCRQGAVVKARGTKLLIKNIPFEASKGELRELFAAFGQVRSVRMPMKFDGTHRGYVCCDVM